MNRKGFTLIELLAVIVILAIIALIATPAVLNIIEDSRKSAAEASARNIVNAAKTFYMNETMNGRTPGSVDLSGTTLKYDGDQASKGNISFTNGDASGKMYISGYCVEVDIDGNVTSEKMAEEDCDINSTSTPAKVYNDGDPVYFNVYTGEKCDVTDYHVDNSIPLYNGIPTGTTKTTNNQNGCLKFYAFNDTEDAEKVSLLLDHNIAVEVYWNSTGENYEGPSDEEGYILNALYNTTNEWKGTETPDNYISPDHFYGSFEIDYSNYKARIIAAQEIADLTGASSTTTGFGWQESDDKANFYFDGSGTEKSGWTSQVAGTCDTCTKTKSDYAWLYDRYSTTCVEFGCENNASFDASPYGQYWTVGITRHGSYAWFVGGGSLNKTIVNPTPGSSTSSTGVRPVIEVLKANL